MLNLKLNKALSLVLLFFATALMGYAQVTHTFPAEDTNNAFTGINSFSHINSTLYVGAVTGQFSTIQSAVTAGCTSGTKIVVDIPAGSSPADIISAVTGGCSTTGIVDERNIPFNYYTWNGSVYTAVTSGGGVSQIIAGPGIGVSPSGGTGAVTLSATGTGSAFTSTWPGLVTFGDSICNYTGPSIGANAFVSKLAAQLGGSLNNTCVSGWWIQDEPMEMYLAGSGGSFNGSPVSNPTQGNNPLNLEEAGKNDATNCTTNANCIATSQLALQTILTHRGSNNIVSSSAATKTGTWATDSVIPQAQASTTQGSSLTFSITTYGTSAIGISYRALMNNGGTASVTIDGIAQSSGITAQGVGNYPPNSGSGGGTVLTNLYPVAAGTHSVVIAVTSTTNSSNLVSITDIVSAGNPSASQNSPFVGSMEVIPYQTGSSYNNAWTAGINTMKQTTVTTLSGYGFNVKWLPITNVPCANGVAGCVGGFNATNYIGNQPSYFDPDGLQGNGSTTDAIHPNDPGHKEIFMAIQKDLNIVQASSSGSSVGSAQRICSIGTCTIQSGDGTLYIGAGSPLVLPFFSNNSGLYSVINASTTQSVAISGATSTNINNVPIALAPLQGVIIQNNGGNWWSTNVPSFVNQRTCTTSCTLAVGNGIIYLYSGATLTLPLINSNTGPYYIVNTSSTTASPIAFGSGAMTTNIPSTVGALGGIVISNNGGNWWLNASTGGTTTNPITLNNSGSGAASGTTFNGSAPVTLSYNTIGAQQVLTLTTTGSSGPATLSGGALNIPQYSGTSGVSSITGTTAATGAIQFTGGGVSQSGNTFTFTGGGGGTGTQYSPAYFSATNTVGGVTPFSGLAYFSTTAAPTQATGAQIATIFSTTPSTGTTYLSGDGTQHAATPVGTVAGQIPIYVSGSAYTPLTVSGDCTLSGTGALTCNAPSSGADLTTVGVSSAKLRAASLSTFDPDVMASSVTSSLCAFNGTVTATGSGTTLTVTAVPAGNYLFPGATITGTGITGTVTILYQLTSANGFTGLAGTYVTSASTTASGTITFTLQDSESTGFACALHNAIAYFDSNSSKGAVVRAHSSHYNLPYPVVLPNRSYSSNSISIIGETGCSVTATAQMSYPMISVPANSPNGAAPAWLNCDINQNYLASGGIDFSNTFNSRVENVNFSGADYKNGNGNSNFVFQCKSCGNQHWKNLTAGTGTSGYTGTLADVSVTVSSGQISSFFIGQKAYAMNITAAGSGGTVGTYNWTSSAGAGSCNNSPNGTGTYPSGTLTVASAGAGYSSPVVTNKGMWCNGGALTITVAGSPGVTGATFTLSFDSGMRGIGISLDAYGNPSVPHIYYYGGNTGNQLKPCTTMPPQYQNTNSGGSNYSLQLAYQQVNEPTFTLDGNGNPTAITFSGSHTEAGCSGPMYAYINTGGTLYSLVPSYNASDGGGDDWWLTGGALVGAVMTGNPQMNRLHSQTPVGRIWAAGYGSDTIGEIDSNLIAGIQVTNSYVNIDKCWYGYNSAGDYPGTVVVAVSTTNSTQNSRISNCAGSGLPADVGDFLPFTNASGAFNTTGATFYTGQVIRNWAHASSEPGLAQEILNEQQTVRTADGTQQALTLTTTGTSGAATLVGGTLNIPQYSGGSGPANVYTSGAFTGIGAGATSPTSTLVVNGSTSTLETVKGGSAQSGDIFDVMPNTGTCYLCVTATGSVNMLGNVNQVNVATTAGRFGIPVITYDSNSITTAHTTAITTPVVIASSAYTGGTSLTQMFKVHCYMNVAVAGGTSVTLQLAWTDNVGAKTSSFAAMTTSATTTYFDSGELLIPLAYNGTSNNIQYTTTLSGTGMTYGVTCHAEEVNW